MVFNQVCRLLNVKACIVSSQVFHHLIYVEIFVKHFNRFYFSYPKQLIYEKSQTISWTIWFKAICKFSFNIIIEPLDHVRFSNSQCLYLFLRIYGQFDIYILPVFSSFIQSLPNLYILFIRPNIYLTWFCGCLEQRGRSHIMSATGGGEGGHSEVIIGVMWS